MEEKTHLSDLLKTFGGKVTSGPDLTGLPVLVVEKESFLSLVEKLRAKPLDFTMLLDLTCVDHQGREPRFEMVYHFLSLSANSRIRVKIPLSEKDLQIASLTSIWKNADWLEREIHDMFGVEFSGHPYMKRLFMYEGFEGHPLRKDYPLRKRQPRIPMRK